MAQQTEEQETQETQENQNPEGNNQNPPPENDQDSNPPIKDDDFLKQFQEKEKVFLDTFKEQSTQLSKKDKELADLRNRIAQLEKPPEKEITDEEYFKKPAEFTRAIVKKELDETVAPILDFIKGFKTENAYTGLKNRFKSNPAFATVLSDPVIEAAVDQMMQNAEPNEANMQAAILSAAGAKAMGILGTSTTPTPTNNNSVSNQNNNSNPPVIRNNAPPPPPKKDDKKPIVLNEHEKLVCKISFGGNVEEFVKWRDMAATDVVGDVND